MNAALNSEGDYIGALKHLAIPIAEEFQPELVLISLGFDSAYYDDLLEHGQGIKAPGFKILTFLLHQLFIFLKFKYHPSNQAQFF